METAKTLTELKNHPAQVQAPNALKEKVLAAIRSQMQRPDIKENPPAITTLGELLGEVGALFDRG